MQEAKAECQQFVPEIFFYCIQRWQACYASLSCFGMRLSPHSWKAHLFSACDQAPSKWRQFQGIGNEQKSNLSLFLTYSVLIQHFSLFLSVSPSFLLFLSYFLQCLGLCFLISKTKNPSVDIFHFIKYLEQVTGVAKETAPKPSCQQIPIPGAG